MGGKQRWLPTPAPSLSATQVLLLRDKGHSQAVMDIPFGLSTALLDVNNVLSAIGVVSQVKGPVPAT